MEIQINCFCFLVLYFTGFAGDMLPTSTTGWLLVGPFFSSIKDLQIGISVCTSSLSKFLLCIAIYNRAAGYFQVFSSVPSVRGVSARESMAPACRLLTCQWDCALGFSRAQS